MSEKRAEASRAEAKRERVKEYDRGYQQARKRFLLLLSMIVDSYPAWPSGETLVMLGIDDETAVVAGKAIDRLAKKLTKEAKRLNKPEAVA